MISRMKQCQKGISSQTRQKMQRKFHKLSLQQRNKIQSPPLLKSNKAKIMNKVNKNRNQTMRSKMKKLLHKKKLSLRFRRKLSNRRSSTRSSSRSNKWSNKSREKEPFRTKRKKQITRKHNSKK